MSDRNLFRAWVLILVSTAVAAAADAAGDPATELQAWTKSHVEDLVAVYRQFHTHPELSLGERETAARLAAELKAAGCEVTTGVGGHGVVALLKNGAGPTVLVRTDMDALPIVEATGLPYASQVKVVNSEGLEVGVMHACGHDLHMTCLLGVARYLAAHRDRWRGTALLIGQPAEERVQGAQAMLDDGLYPRFGKPDYALALHVAADLATGQVSCRPGYVLANTDSLDITVRGKGGHGAAPHTTVDPIVEAAQLVLALQTIVSREVNPTEPAVITVGSIHGGTKHNIIADSCHLQLTVRSFSEETRQLLLDAIERKAKAVALGCRAPEPTIRHSESVPAVFNDEPLTARIQGVLRRVLGAARVQLAKPETVSEDFGLFGQAGVPLLMFRLGSVDGPRLERYRQLGQSPPSLHSAAYYPDAEATLSTGIVAMASAVLDLLPP
jgi:amidohydrolase